MDGCMRFSKNACGISLGLQDYLDFYLTADMKACSEFFQCSEGFFDWLKNFFVKKCQKYIIDFYFMTKTVH